MRIQRKYILLAILVLTVCGLGLALFLSHEPPEPTYDGKPLSYWLQACGRSVFGLYTGAIPQHPTEEEASHAIREMGTNAVPPLLRMLRAHDSKLKTKVMDLLQRQDWIEIYSEPAVYKNIKAASAFEILGPSAGNAVPQLIHILETDSSAFAQQNIPGILGHIGPAARQAIPMLLRTIGHTNEVVRNNAVYALGQIRAEPKKVVPVFVKCLNDPNPLVQVQAIKSLNHFGADARPAVPALLEWLRREKENPTGRLGRNASVVSVNLNLSSWGALPVNYIDLLNSDPLKIAQEALKSIDP